MQSSEAFQDSVGVIERPSLRAAAALNPIRQSVASAAVASPQAQPQDVSDSDSEVNIPTSNFTVHIGSSGAAGGSGSGMTPPSRLLSACLPPMAPPTMSPMPRHPTETSSSHDDPLLAGNVNAMSHSSQFLNSQSQSHITGHLAGINSNSGSFRNIATANNNNQIATPNSHGFEGVVLGSDTGGSGVYNQTHTMTQFRVDPSLAHHHHQTTIYNNNHGLSPSPSSKGGANAGSNNFTTVMVGSGGIAGGSGTYSSRGVGALPAYSYVGTVGESDSLSHSSGSGFQTASHNGDIGHYNPTAGNVGLVPIAGRNGGHYVHIQGSNVPLHPVPHHHPSTTSGASFASDDSKSFTGSVDAAAGSHGHGALPRLSNPHPHQHSAFNPTSTTQHFHASLVSVGATPRRTNGHQMTDGGASFVVSSSNNRSGSFDGMRVGGVAAPLMSHPYQHDFYNNNNTFNQSSTSNRYTNNTSSSPNAPTTVNNHTTTTTSGFMTTTPSDLMMTSNNNNNRMSSSPLMAMFTSNTPQQQFHHQNQQRLFHLSSSLPLSEPLTFVSPANAVTNSSCLSGDVPMSGGAIPTYETTGRPMDAFEMAMLREQYLHGAFHVPVDPNDMLGKKKRRRRKRRKNLSGADMSGSEEDPDEAAAAEAGNGTEVEVSQKKTSADTPAATGNSKPDIKSKSRVLIVPGVPVHLPLVGKVGFIPYNTVLRQFASLQAKKSHCAGTAPESDAATVNATDVTLEPDFVNDTVNAVDAAIKSAEAAVDIGRDLFTKELSKRSKEDDEEDVDAANDDAVPPPSYTDVLIEEDGEENTAATATAQARLFVGQVPYSIELDLMKAIFFVIGGGCDVDHVERIVKWKNRELPSGCLHVHINVEYNISDYPVGSNADPTEASSLVHHALKLDQVALLDDEGIWVPTSNRRAFSIVDTHVEAFEAFLSHESDLDAAATAATTTTTAGGSNIPSPAASQDLSQYGPPKPRTMGTFGLTFDEFKGFLRGCAKEVRNTMPDYAVTWSEEEESQRHVDSNTTSYLPPVPVIHPDIAAIAIHGRAGGTHAKPPAPHHNPNHEDLAHHQNGAPSAASNVAETASAAVSGAVSNPCEAIAKGLLCLPVPGFGGALPHTRPLFLTHNNIANASNRDESSCLSTTASNSGGDAGGGKSTHQRITSTMTVRPPKGPEDPEFVVPSLSDQREALVAYVSYLKDMNSMQCRPIDRPYQLMSVQRARSTFLPQQKSGTNNTTTVKSQPATTNAKGNNSASAQQRLLHNQHNIAGFVPSSVFNPAHHQQMFTNQHYDPHSMLQHNQQQQPQHQQQAMMYQHHQQHQFYSQHLGFVNQSQYHQHQGHFMPPVHQQQQHIQQTTNIMYGFQHVGAQQQQHQHAAFQNNNTNLIYNQHQHQPGQSQNINNTSSGYAPFYHHHNQQRPVSWKQ